MEGVVGKNQLRSLRFRQPVFDERQITILVAAINFVADNRMAEVREVDANLVFAAGAGDEAQKREAAFTRFRRAKWRMEGGTCRDVLEFTLQRVARTS